MRIHFIDNIKGILIVLVVVGHLLLPCRLCITEELLYESIYLFHMPLFIFISGFLAKRAFSIEKGLRVDKIISFVVLALAFQLVLTVLESNPERIVPKLCSLKFGGAPWYLISLATWYALTPLFAKFKPAPCIALSCILALLAGFVPDLGNFLSLSRTVVFMPFFLMGYFCSTERLQEIATGNYARVALVGAIIFLACLIVSGGGIFSSQFHQVYGNSSYDDRGILGMLDRLQVFVVAIVLSLGLMAIVPKKQSTVLAYLGQRTLQIYILHRIIRSLLSMMGFYELPVLADLVLGPAVLLAVSAAIIAVCAIPILGKPLDYVVQCKWKVLLRGNKS